MKLVSVTLSNFRGYGDPVRIPISDLTAFVGRNDVGKSTILEALEVFFNNEAVKIDPSDRCVRVGDRAVEIACEFDQLPENVIIDTMSETTLAEELLLNTRGNLEIAKRYDCSGAKAKESVFARAVHPTEVKSKDLLQKKNAELKITATNLGATAEDARSNASLRRAIRDVIPDLQLQEVLVPLDKEDAKQAWEVLKKQLPAFALFQSDRQSKDDDGEVQNPLKAAIVEAIALVEHEMDRIRDTVQEYALKVASRTLDKLRELDPTLASQLTPQFKSEPTYTGFKITLTGDDEIPINKRGSGVRRLILLSFFRAEAEHRQLSLGAPGVIYAIEEPESSQHPNYQRMLISALIQLSQLENVQVIITTHVPGIAAILPQDSLRLVERTDQGYPIVREPNDDTLRAIADSLGVLPDNRVQVLLYLEGPHDVSFLDRMGAVLRTVRPEIPIPSTDPRIGIIITGGGNLKHWVNHRYLRALKKPEVHIYDRDKKTNPGNQPLVTQLLQQGQKAFLTTKREAENYLHPDAVNEGCGHQLASANWDWDDVPALLAEAVHSADPSSNPWDRLDEKARKKKCSNAKERLNIEAADKMTVDRLKASDPTDEIEGWFDALLCHMSAIP